MRNVTDVIIAVSCSSRCSSRPSTSRAFEVGKGKGKGILALQVGKGILLGK